MLMHRRALYNGPPGSTLRQRRRLSQQNYGWIVCRYQEQADLLVTTRHSQLFLAYCSVISPIGLFILSTSIYWECFSYCWSLTFSILGNEDMSMWSPSIIIILWETVDICVIMLHYSGRKCLQSYHIHLRPMYLVQMWNVIHTDGQEITNMSRCIDGRWAIVSEKPPSKKTITKTCYHGCNLL